MFEYDPYDLISSSLVMSFGSDSVLLLFLVVIALKVCFLVRCCSSDNLMDLYNSALVTDWVCVR